MNILTFLFVVCLGIAGFGYLVRKSAEAGVDQLLFAWARALTSMLLLTLVAVANFALAATSLERILGREPYRVHSQDPFGWLLFGSKGILTPRLWAFALVLVSFLAAGVLLRQSGKLLSALFARDTEESRWLRLIPAFCLIVAAVLFIGMDSFILTFRVAMYLHPDLMAGDISSVPAPWSFSDFSTLGGALIAITAFAYPAGILLAERQCALSWSIATELSRGYPVARIQEDVLAERRDARAVPARDDVPEVLVDDDEEVLEDDDEEVIDFDEVPAVRH